MRLLPLRSAPRPGEAFASFVERLAARLELPLIMTMKATGLTSRDHFTTLPTGYGIAMAPDQLARFCSATGLSATRVEGMLVRSYHGVAIDFSDVRPEEPSTIRRAAVREWFYASGSHVCPACIAEDHAWRLAWKLPFSFVCLRHTELLAAICPGCGGRTGAGRRDGRTAPVLPSLVPRPGLCQNPLPIGEAVPGRREVCGYPLEALERQDLVEWPAVVAAQRAIDRRLVNPEPTSLDYFRRLRSLTALVLAVADRPYLGALPHAAEVAWDAFEDDREAAAAARRRTIANGADGRKGPRTRYWQRAPVSSGLMAAVVPSALGLADALDTVDGAVAEPLVELMRLARRRESHGAAQMAMWFHFPPALASAWRGVFDQTTPRFVQRQPVQKLPDPAYTTPDSRHVPQMFPQQLYCGSLAACFDGVVAAEVARKFCSLAVVRLTGAETWVEAARALCIPPERAANLTNHVVYRLRQVNRAEDFWCQLKRAAQQLAANPQVDYRAREVTFRAWDAIPRDDWVIICTRSGLRAGKPGGRSRCAAAFVWQELTGRPWHEAPAYGGHPSASEREVYRRFERDLLPRLRDDLVGFAMRTASTSGPTPGASS